MDFLCSLPILASLFSTCLVEPPFAVGYVEGEFALVAPIEVAQISTVLARRGDRVEAGVALVEMERRDAEIERTRAQAELARAQSQLADIEQGKRPEEIAMFEAALMSARVQMRESERELARNSDLFERAVISQAHLDTARTIRDIAGAKVSELEASLAVARLPARLDQIAAAKAAVAQQQAVLANSDWRIENRTLVSPDSGLVFDIIRHAGEIAGPQQPVLSFLPDGSTKLRLYIPETSLQTVSVGTILRVSCDGCGTGMRAKVNYISDHPEFTPPVIYSLQSRQKLVVLIEAKPLASAAALKPGQIVDVQIHGHTE
ncbi:MAG: HlyD family efflux transporter periplasmic adaptor subunit [Rhodobacteraceae bacterium]|nr:HlyD family efflux transporter periplasmic adaptor subunit [Paracoccaceae bacterium]